MSVRKRKYAGMPPWLSGRWASCSLIFQNASANFSLAMGTPPRRIRSAGAHVSILRAENRMTRAGTRSEQPSPHVTQLVISCANHADSEGDKPKGIPPVTSIRWGLL